jgi:predicted DNA-binding WGR domain protein
VNFFGFFLVDLVVALRACGRQCQWRRIGAHGQIKAARYDNEALATAALQRQAKRKRRRDYSELPKSQDFK